MTSVPSGSVAVAVPRLAYRPRSASAVAVQVVERPGARLSTGQETVTPAWSSVTSRPVSLALPVLVTR